MGAFTRQRGIKSVAILLRILLIHLADGCSLRESVARAKQGKLANISDVALLKRLRNCAEWFRWMSGELIANRGSVVAASMSWLNEYQIKSADASVITEPGSTGTDWRLHYSINLIGLQCDQFHITSQKTGESFLNFQIASGDLWIADRAYGTHKGLLYVQESGGSFIVRLKNKAFSLFSNEEEFNMVRAFKDLAIGQIGEWAVEGRVKAGKSIKLRLCVLRKTKQQAEESIKKMLKDVKKKEDEVDPETIDLYHYIILVTSLPDSISAKSILELYRFRWQIEIAFKRLKSIMGLGHLPKKDEQSCQAWLQGKIFVALLAQAIVDEGRHFSPWGYPMGGA